MHRRRLLERSSCPPIGIVTGPRGSGRTTYAVMVCAERFKQGVPCFHNSTASFGWNTEEYANVQDGLLKLADQVPSGSIIMIEEADACNATRQMDDPTHEANIALALTILAEKKCSLILTTVQGNERLIASTLIENSYEHVTPYIDAKTMESLSLRTTHRIGKYLIPVTQIPHDPESVIEAMKLANTFRDMRQGTRDGKEVQYTEDCFVEVSQTSIDDMKHPKHPAYPVYYRHRIVNKVMGRIIHRLTQASILYFTWLESVNEHPNETIALEFFRRTMPQWGFEYEAVQTAHDTSFPDGQAVIDGEPTNLEVISIQPRYPGGHSLHDLLGLTQPGWAAKPEDTAILHCQTCRTTEPATMPSLQEIPEHDESHRWVIYVPASQFTPDFPSNVTVTPLLTITQEGFTRELENALDKKSKIIAEQGAGKRNWVIVVAQGFPINADWYSRLPEQWPDNIDGICVVATETYLGAFYDLLPFKDFVVVLLKCPSDILTHNCYHPGYGYRASTLDVDLQPFSKDLHTIEEMSTAALNYPWPAIPIRRTLTVRNERGEELTSYLGATLTESQVSEILNDAGYNWYELSYTDSALRPERNAFQAKCLAWVQRVKKNDWVGWAIYDGSQVEETFDTAEDARRWCEYQIAMILLHLEG